MTAIQLVIARSALQTADSVSAGEVVERKDKLSAVWLFDQLARYVFDLTEGEYAAMLAQFAPIHQVSKQVDQWRDL